jgi:reductive dehalogenase
MAKETNIPTYEKDVTDVIRRFDERDNVFAREELAQYFGEDSPEFDQYYSLRPEFLKPDTKRNKRPSRSWAGGIDNSMSDAMFSYIDRISSEKFVDGTPNDVVTKLTPERAQYKVKALARALGADLVKTGPLRQEWVYSTVGRSHGNQAGYQPLGTPIDLKHHTNAIALGFRIDYDMLQTAPDFACLLATMIEYSKAAWATVQLADYIRRLGYSARAHHLKNYQVLAIPIAVDCGLGELSRAGYLMTKECGLWLRLSVVTTDLPLVHDSPVDIAAQSFCTSCQICAQVCPVGAIPEGDKTEHNGLLKWKADADKCLAFWYAHGTDCGLCMAACPWSKPPNNAIHQTMASIASVEGPHQRLMAAADKMAGRITNKPSIPDYLESD